MQTKINLLIIGAVIIVAGFVFLLVSGPSTSDAPVETTMPAAGSAVQETVVVGDAATTLSIKEFTMTAYYDEKGKWFSLSEMVVKKGDTVRVKITNTKGMHDFVIDELGVAVELPMNEEVVVEFTANTVGDFVYYCSKPGHRAGGQWGTLKVTE